MSTIEEALDLALEALEVNNQAWKSLADSGDAGFWEAEEQPFYELSVKAITAIKQARALDKKAENARELGLDYEPVAFFDWYDNAHWGNEDFKESCHRSWNAAIKYTTPPAQPAPVQEPVADGLIRQYITALVANKPDEAANATKGMVDYVYTTPPAARRTWVGLTDEEKRIVCRVGPVYAPDGVVTRTPLQYRKELEGVSLMAVRQAEAQLKERNNG